MVCTLMGMALLADFGRNPSFIAHQQWPDGLLQQDNFMSHVQHWQARTSGYFLESPRFGPVKHLIAVELSPQTFQQLMDALQSAWLHTLLITYHDCPSSSCLCCTQWSLWLLADGCYVTCQCVYINQLLQVQPTCSKCCLRGRLFNLVLILNKQSYYLGAFSFSSGMFDDGDFVYLIEPLNQTHLVVK